MKQTCKSTAVFLQSLLLITLTQAVPFARVSSFAGIDMFKCTNPTMTDFNFDALTGNWHQAYATWGTDKFGCIWMTIRDVEGSGGYIDAHWTVTGSYPTPLSKGAKSHTYQVKASTYGVIQYDLPFRINPVLYHIVDTDYSSYILAYHCEQEWLDFYTAEYFDIYTPDGTITTTLLNTLKAKIVTAMSPKSFDIDSLEVATYENCRVTKDFYIF